MLNKNKLFLSILFAGLASTTIYSCNNSTEVSPDSMPVTKTEKATAAVTATLNPGQTYNNVTWSNGAIINQSGTYTIKGTCKGMIRVDANNVVIQGDQTGGKLVDINSTDQVGWPHMIKGIGNNVMLKNLTIQTSFKNKSISLDGSGSDIKNCNLISSDTEFETGHIQATGLISDCFSSLHDDNYKVRLEGRMLLT